MEELLKTLIERIDLLIKLQAITAFRESSRKYSTCLLYERGLTPEQIAVVLTLELEEVNSYISKTARYQQSA